MKSIDVDKLFMIKAFINDFDSMLNVNDQTEEPVFTYNISIETSTNRERLDEEEEASANNDTDQTKWLIPVDNVAEEASANREIMDE